MTLLSFEFGPQWDYEGAPGPESHPLIWKPNKPKQLALKIAYKCFKVKIDIFLTFMFVTFLILFDFCPWKHKKPSNLRQISACCLPCPKGLLSICSLVLTHEQNGTILEQFWNNFGTILWNWKTYATSEKICSYGASSTAGKLQTFHAKLWPGIVLQDHIPNLKIIAQTKEI